MAWLETENRVYVDQLIEAGFRFDSMGGYCAAGIMFRFTSPATYYLALVSSKGFFRLDAVNNNVPRPLIGWTEIQNFSGSEAQLSMIAYNDHLIIFLNGRWVAETNDASIPGGHLGFALASYESAAAVGSEGSGEEYTCRAWLDYFMVDSRPRSVKSEYKKWNFSVEISAESRYRLAQSFAALNCFDAAYTQILRTWEQREESAKSIMATITDMRNIRELFFAARMALLLGRYEAAEEYIDACITLGESGALPKSGVIDTDIFAEKAKILGARHKYSELAVFLPEYIALMEESGTAGTASLYALLGHAQWNLHNYEKAAAAWDNAFNLDRNNELYAVNAANAFEKTGNIDAAHKLLKLFAKINGDTVTNGDTVNEETIDTAISEPLVVVKKAAAPKKTPVKKAEKKAEKKPALKPKAPVTKTDKKSELKKPVKQPVKTTGKKPSSKVKTAVTAKPGSGLKTPVKIKTTAVPVKKSAVKPQKTAMKKPLSKVKTAVKSKPAPQITAKLKTPAKVKPKAVPVKKPVVKPKKAVTVKKK